MKRIIGNAMLGLLVVLTGCIPSLHSLYTEQDLTLNQALVGQWISKDDWQWSFTQAGEKEYKLVVQEKNGDMGVFTAHLLMVETNLFLDLQPYNGPDEMPFDDVKLSEFFGLHFVPAHTFYRVVQVGPSWQLACLDPDWLVSMLKENPEEIAHEMLEGNRMVLTASPRELQAFVVKYANTSAAWYEWPTLTKKAEPDAEAGESGVNPANPNAE